MSNRRIAWQDGDERVQRWVEGWIAGASATSGELLYENPRRILYRLETTRELSIDSSGATAIRGVIVKIHRTHTGRHQRRESIKRRIGYSPALREWQALSELHALGVPVPEPLAWGILPGGDPLLVTEYFEGRALSSVLTTEPADEQIRWIDRLAQAVSALHEAGFRHGDLHLGNLHVREDEVMILDLQRARRARNRKEKLRDLAHLDFSIARMGLRIRLRRRLRERFGAPPGLDLVARRFVRDFLRGRSRREHRVGRAWSSWQPHSFRGIAGLQDESASPAALERALRSAIADPRPNDRRGGRTRVSVHLDESRPMIVKRTTQLTRAQCFADRLRGSPARREFRSGQRLALLGALGAKPLAAVEERPARRPVTSWLILERVGIEDLDRYQPRSEEDAQRCCVELAAWIAEWHAWGIDHLDLKASNIRIDDREDTFRFWLVDLGDLRFRRHLSDAARLRALIQLNASLADEAFSLEARKRGLDDYRERLPFKRLDRDELIEAITRRSLARKHRWQALGREATR
jgi:tRNA A-37 threonylcarbamoyl transferase component Bud32